jgi:hypothetical protein
MEAASLPNGSSDRSLKSERLSLAVGSVEIPVKRSESDSGTSRRESRDDSRGESRGDLGSTELKSEAYRLLGSGTVGEIGKVGKVGKVDILNDPIKINWAQ